MKFQNMSDGKSNGLMEGEIGVAKYIIWFGKGLESENGKIIQMGIWTSIFAKS